MIEEQLILVNHWLINLYKDMEQDSRCKTIYTNAVAWFSNEIQDILYDKG